MQRLRAELDEARRAGKRQAAPFDPGKPGRKAGDGHGTHARRAVPDVVHRTVEVPAPDVCPCGAAAEDSGRVVELAGSSAAGFAEAVKAVLDAALSLREMILKMGPHGRSVALGRLDALTARLLSAAPADPDALRFRNHLLTDHHRYDGSGAQPQQGPFQDRAARTRGPGRRPFTRIGHGWSSSGRSAEETEARTPAVRPSPRPTDTGWHPEANAASGMVCGQSGHLFKTDNIAAGRP